MGLAGAGVPGRRDGAGGRLEDDGDGAEANAARQVVVWPNRGKWGEHGLLSRLAVAGNFLLLILEVCFYGRVMWV